jgi:predicted TIM-barrel fold metal-dependent hydrolase
MIIDSHTHIGTIRDFSITGEMLLDSMRRYGIGFALVSSVEGAEYDGGTKELEPWRPQCSVNEDVANLARARRDRLKGLFWIKPRREGWSSEVARFMEEYRDVMAGFKAHPTLSMLNITDEKYIPYIRCAERMRLPFAVHSASDEFSLPRAVYDTARRFTGVNFIMVHMGLGTDNTEAAGYIRELPNLYGDTSWVPGEHVVRAVRECGSGKILFGTDAPIDGEETYGSYTDMIAMLRRELTVHEFDDVFRGNAMRLFGLEL